MKLSMDTQNKERMVLTIQNVGGRVTALLYLKPNGNLHEDSWISPMGWMDKLPIFGEAPELGGDPLTVAGDERL